MSIDLSRVTGISDSRGVITEIKDSLGRVIWAISGGKVILEVEKITSDTYAGETTYTGESFILLDIYPKTNGTVKVTYGGLTKTITDTSGSAEPNAQQVFFGTYNGVTDGVATPDSGTLTITGDCVAIGQGCFNQDNSAQKSSVPCTCITAVEDFGNVEKIPPSAFSASGYGNIDHYALKRVIFNDNVVSIGDSAFKGCYGLEQMIISASVTSIAVNAFDESGRVLDGSFLTIDANNPRYSYINGCLIDKSNNEVFKGFSIAVIPSGVTSIASRTFYNTTLNSAIFSIPDGVKTIGEKAFYGADGITDLILPSSLTNIGINGCYCSAVRVVSYATTPPTVDTGDSGAYPFRTTEVESITVPKGCGSAYKAATGWSYFASKIVEVS